MADDNPSIISHVSVGTNRFAEARAFYEKVLATLGCRIIMEHPGAAAFGKQFPEFWVQKPHRRQKGGHRQRHSFRLRRRARRPRSTPSTRRPLPPAARMTASPAAAPDYGEPYYGCFVRDLDGHKIEAAFWDEELAKKLGMG